MVGSGTWERYAMGKCSGPTDRVRTPRAMDVHSCTNRLNRMDWSSDARGRGGLYLA